MPRTDPIVTNFTTGEVSPRVEGRMDMPQYRNSCRKLENFLVRQQGGVDRRPGTFYVATAKTAAQKPRLMSLVVDDDNKFILEFGENYIRFFKNGAVVGAPEEEVTTYLWAELFELQFAQDPDGVLYIVHHLHAPATLTKGATDTDWTLANITFGTTTVYEDFNAAGDYPSCITFHGGRLILAATDNNPQTIWGSDIGTYTEFDESTPNAWEKTYAGKGFDRIRWLQGKDDILIGTSSGEILLTAYGAPITNASGDVLFQSGFGSKNMDSQLVGDVVLFVQQGGRKIREYGFIREASTFRAIDLTILAEHITLGGINQLALQTEPQTILWCVRNDGQLVGLTYDKQYQLVGWFRYVTDGDIESVAVIPTSTEDQVWISVLRDTDTNRFIEYFKPYDWGTDNTEMFFVDSGITFDGGAAKNITGVAIIDRIDRGDCESATPPMIFDETVPVLTSMTFARDNAEAHAGTYSYKVTKTIASGTAAYVSLCDNENTNDMHGLFADKTYTFEVWVKVPTVGGTALNEIRIWIEDYDGSWVASYSGNPTAFDTWQKLKVTRTIRSGATGATIGIEIISTAGDTEFFYVDDIELIEHPPIVTSVAHGLSTGDFIKIRNVGGMVELNTTNNGIFYITNLTADTFSLQLEDGTTDVDGTTFTAFDSGITGDTTYGTATISNVSAADIALLFVGMVITGTGIPSGTTITALSTVSFTISADTTANGTDVALTVMGTATPVKKIITGLTHLNLETVSILADGAPLADEIVANNQITIDEYSNKVHVGQKITSKLQPMRFGVTSKKKITKLALRLYKTLTCKVGTTESNVDPIEFRTGADLMDTEISPFTGDKEVVISGGYNNAGDIMIIADQPLPCNILSIEPRMSENVPI